MPRTKRKKGVSTYTLSFGGNWDGVGNLLRANGEPPSGDVAVSEAATRHPAPRAGTLNFLGLMTKGDLSVNNATIKILVAGSVVKTLTAVSGANGAENYEDLDIAVEVNEFVEIEFDAGSTNPTDSIANMIIET